ncbi:importin-beta domain-containing protein [Apiospora phragmitis]|uniref:Importin-beta domain-containing protein n=1 Tax=Apiospora phragmitis TaxID=2905665 RepID=A0ABR1V157_9PEZI
MTRSTKTTANLQSQASAPDSSDPRPSSRGSRSAVRVSLACVQCRSKHMKCDATLPAYKRCTNEGKTCFYAKSRRGIRDQKKRSLMSDRPVVLPMIETIGPEARVPRVNPTCNVEDGNLMSWAPSVCITPGSGAYGKHRPLDFYYSCFHVAHPFILPQRFLLKQGIADPSSMHFLLMAINYIGSLYSGYRSDELRDAAYAAACALLPITPQSVQGLLIMSLAAFGNATFTYHSGWLHRANTMAQELGMHKKGFAAAAPDSVVAESYRRTYWGLYWLDVCRNIFETKSLCDLPGDVDLPCEEWEYESGNIPNSTSLAQYDVHSALGTAEFSSLAYLVDLCRIIATYVLTYHDAPEDKKGDLFERADSLRYDWILKVPAWKLDLVNSEGSVDIVLQQAIGLAHNSRLKIRDNVARNKLSLKESCSLGPIAGPSVGAQKVKCFGWHAITTEMQAANDMLALFRKPLDLKHLSPLLVSGMQCVALVYLDACVFQGLDTPVYREKLTMLTQILAVHGQIWEVSRSFTEELRDVVAEYLSAPMDPTEPSQDEIWPPPASAVTAGDAIGECRVCFSRLQSIGHL